MVRSIKTRCFLARRLLLIVIRRWLWCNTYFMLTGVGVVSLWLLIFIQFLAVGEERANFLLLITRNYVVFVR